MNFFRNLSIRSKMLMSYLSLAALATLLGSIILYSIIYNILEKNIEAELKSSTNTILKMVKAVTASSIRNHLRAVAEKNNEIVTSFYNQYKNGSLTEDEAKQKAKEVLLSQTIGKTGYIFCINSDGIIKVHPKNKLNEVNLSKNRFIRIQKKRKEGYVEYKWANPDEPSSRKKALYMSYFEPWDWIISVSSYRSEFSDLFSTEDLEQSILSMKFGETGYSYIMDKKGNVVIHPKLKRGDNYLYTKDPTGRMFFKEMIDKKSGRITYSWQNPGEERAREKLAIFNYVPELGWSVISSSYREEFYAHLKEIGYAAGGIALTMVVIIFLFTWWISSSLTKPLLNLTHNFEQGAKGDFSSRMPINRHDEIGRLSRYYNNFMTQLQQYSGNMEELVRERTKELHEALKQVKLKTHELFQKNQEIEIDLNTAEGLQRELFTRYSQPSYLKIATKYLPYSHVSGDIYKLYQNDEQAFNLFLGDSTGHGVAAALTTIMADILLLQQKNSPPIEAIQHINESLAKSLPPERFMTAVHVQISEDGELILVSAGHPPVIIIPANGGTPILLASTESTLLGIFSNDLFKISQIDYQLQKGDKGILYSDGIIECCDSDGRMFGIKQLCQFVEDNRSNDIKTLLNLLLTNMNTFSRSKKLDDDITLVAFEYTGR